MSTPNLKFQHLQGWVVIFGPDITRGCRFPEYYEVIKALLAMLVGASIFPQDESNDSYDSVHKDPGSHLVFAQDVPNTSSRKS